LFRELGRLMGQSEGVETGGGATPLVDATVRFLDEFTHKEKLSPTHQFLQQATRGKVREDEHGKKEDDGVHPFLSTYVFDAMKKKRQFITIRVRSCAHVIAFVTDLRWSTLYYRMASNRMRLCF
jgi:ubiquitin carboxyl-terminal hydrolase 10